MDYIEVSCSVLWLFMSCLLIYVNELNTLPCSSARTEL